MPSCAHLFLQVFLPTSVGRQATLRADAGMAPGASSASSSTAFEPCHAHVAAESASLDELERQLAALGGGDEAMRHLLEAASELEQMLVDSKLKLAKETGQQEEYVSVPPLSEPARAPGSLILL